MSRCTVVVGDEVTVVMRGRSRVLLRTVVTCVDDWALWAGDTLRAPDGEGITWIRGHHADDSPAAAALLAAYALVRG